MLKKVAKTAWPYRHKEDSLATIVMIGLPVSASLVYDWLVRPEGREWSVAGLALRIAGVCGVSTIAGQRGPRGLVLATGVAAAIPIIDGVPTYGNTMADDIRECVEFGVAIWFAERATIWGLRWMWQGSKRVFN